MYSKTIWQKRFAKALACGFLLVASAYPAASAAPAMLALGHLYEEGLGTTRVTKIETSAIWTPVTAIDFSSHHDTMIENADGNQVSMDQPYFTSEQIAPDTWKIQNDGDYCYLLAGDETKNAPEIIPTGQRMSYTVDSFPVTYIETTSASSN